MFPKREYIGPDPYEDLPFGKRDSWRSILSAVPCELIFDIMNRGYQCILSDHGGFKTIVRRPSIIGDIPEFISRNTSEMQIISEYSDNELNCHRIKKFIRLESLNITGGIFIRNSSALCRLSTLKRFVSEGEFDEEFDVSSFENLLELAISDSLMVTNLEKSKSIKYLLISDFSRDILENFSFPDSVKFLKFYTAKKLKYFGDLSILKNLISLQISVFPKILSMEGIGALENLKRLDIYACSRLSNIDDIAFLKNLELLEIRDCKSLKTSPFFDESPRLSKLFFTGRTKIQNGEDVISNSPGLKYYYF